MASMFRAVQHETIEDVQEEFIKKQELRDKMKRVLYTKMFKKSATALVEDDSNDDDDSLNEKLNDLYRRMNRVSFLKEPTMID